MFLIRHLRTHSDNLNLNSCLMCGDVFEQESDLIKHICRPPPSEGVHCEFCSQVLISDQRYNRHVNSKHMDRIADIWNKCDDCSIFFPSENDLKSHKCKIKKEQLKCILCEATFSLPLNLRMHIITKHPNDSIKECRICQQRFDSEEMFNVHVNKEHKESLENTWPPCILCSTHFASQREFTAHKCNRTFKCAQGEATYTNQNHLERHTSTKHPAESKKELNCLFCSLKFISVKLYRIHANREHLDSIENAWPQCPKCLSRFPSEQSLKMHNNCCKTSKRRKCPKCDASFSHSRDLKNHIESHHSDSLEKCSFCNLEFNKRYSYRYLLHAR